MGKKNGSSINGTPGNDFLEGTGGADRIRGNRGDDVIRGGGGDDQLQGGAGIDTALYSGSFLDYLITTTSVADRRAASPDGTDSISGIEVLQFADHTLFLDGRNNAPFAVADIAATTEDAAVLISGALLVSNDVDFDGDALGIVAATIAEGFGSVSLIDGNVVYDPGSAYQHLAAGGTAIAVLEYTVSDGLGGVDSGQVMVSIAGVNDAPTANLDNVSVLEDSVGSIDVLANDADPEGDAFSVEAVDPASEDGALLSVDPDGSIVYDARGILQSLDDGETETDRFNYTARDSHGAVSGPATAFVTVHGVNDAPSTADDGGSATDDGIAAAGDVLANDSDVDVEPLSVANAGTYDLAHGTLVIDADGGYEYRVTDETLAAGDVATDSFTYSAFDGTAASDGTLVLQLSGSNDAPLAADDAYIVPGGLPLSVDAAGGLLANDGDVDANDSLSVVEASFVTAAGAAVSLHADGSFTYAPAPGASGPDSFTYTVSDLAGSTDSGEVSVMVEGVPHPPPLAAPDGFITNAMYGSFAPGPVSIVPMSIPISLLLRNDSPPSGVSITEVSHVTGGTAVISGDFVEFTAHASSGIGTEAMTLNETEPNNNSHFTAPFIPRVAFGPADDGLAHVTVSGVVGSSDLDYFGFTLRAGETITLQSDFGQVSLFSSTGGELALDPGQSYFVTADDFYFARVSSTTGGGFYALDVSLDTVDRAEHGSFGYTLTDSHGQTAFGSVHLVPVFSSTLQGEATGFVESLLGGDLGDVIAGLGGGDLMTGGGGSDRFVFYGTDSGQDVITDFVTGFGGDVIDLRDFPTDYVPGNSQVGDFVRVESFGSGSRVSVDPDGTAGPAFYQPVVILEGVAAVDAAQLLADGNIWL